MTNKFLSGIFGKRKTPRESVEPQGASEPSGDRGELTANEDPSVLAQSDVIEPIAEAPASATSSQTVNESETTRRPEKSKGWLSRLRAGLSKSSGRLTDGVAAIFTKRKLDAETLEELTDLLIMADLGTPAAKQITEALARDKFEKDITDGEVRAALASEVEAILKPLEKQFSIDRLKRPHVILMAGVNGAGKTTTIGKLSQQFHASGLSVMLAAGDTFRAAAIEQLQVWGERTGAKVISRPVGSDAAGLAFDALKAAQAEGVDVLMIDTAGRLQNKKELMDELAKIVRVVKKLDPTAPHDVILTLDATVGQNALSQTAAFAQIAGVTGLVMTKLDGTARGGVLVALAEKFALPIHFIGVGEGVEDLQDFKADEFAAALAGVSTA